jgi:2-succinyl-6-hydroxy-2,4-cyclohexadiene-1-carboxylate synthase
VRTQMIDASGVRLHVRREGSGEPVVLLHGFTATGASMVPLGRRLGGETITVDLVGHGASDAPFDVAHYTMGAMVSQLRALFDIVDVAAAHLVGYSMGARTALSFAAAHPDAVRTLTLIGGTPGIADAEESRERVRADEALADRIVRDGVPAFVDHWESLPLFASQRRLPEEERARIRAERLAQRAHGLANHLRGAGTGAMPSLWTRLGTVRAPTALLVGALDPKFGAIAAAMAARLPHAVVTVVDEAGHAVHLEDPSAVARAARALQARLLP